MMKKHLPLLILSFMMNTNVFGQQSNETPAQFFLKGSYDTCIQLCDDVLKVDAEDKAACFFKGASLVKLKQYKKAKHWLTKANQYEYQPKSAVDANLLRAYAGLVETASLNSLLKTLADNGFRALNILDEEEFSYLKNNSEFIQLKTKVDANVNPCKYGERYQRLDFWLGEWDVYVKDKKIGTSSITKSEGGCTLYEDYKTYSGFLGRSTNYFDPSDEKYTQIWIDKFNSIILFKETKSKENYLQMIADDGKGGLTKMTYTRNATRNEVTQTMESSTDKGETWTVSFVGLYKARDEGK